MPPAYRYCGLTLRSTLPLPELPTLAGAGPAEVTVREAAVPTHLANPLRCVATCEIAGEEALLRLPGVARYRITEGGRLIEVERARGADPAAVRLLLLHPVFALATLLRGDYLLNAAAVAVEGRVVAFLGPSAVGKSSTAAILGGRGCPLVSDALLRITERAGGGFEAHPQAPWLLLWPDVVEGLDLRGAERPAREGLDLRRVARRGAAGPLPLERIVLLREPSGSEPGGYPPAAGSRAFDPLLLHGAGSPWLGALPLVRASHFQRAAWIADATPIEKLAIPRDWGASDWLGRALRRWGRPA